MSIPETSLSAPLTNHLYANFIEVFKSDSLDSFVRERKQLPLSAKLALSLRATQGAPPPHSLIIPHVHFDSPGLFCKTTLDFEDKDRASDVLRESLVDTEVIRKALKDGLNELFSSPLSSLATTLIHTEIPTQVDDVTISLYLSAMYWLTVVTSSCSPEASKGWIRSVDCWVTKDLILVPLKGSWITLSHDALLMFKDATMSHFLVDAYGWINPDKRYLRGDLEFWRKWSFSLLERYGNEAFDLIKSVEPLGTCRLIELSEEYLDAQAQTREMVTKFHKKELKARQLMSLSDISVEDSSGQAMISYLRLTKDPDRIAEVFSMMKLSGHPYVDPVEGCEFIREFGQATPRNSIVGIKAVEWSFCHVYTRGYLLKTGKWPPLRFTAVPGREMTLQRLYDENHPSLPLGLTLYNPSDWDYAQFIPHEEFDYGEDLLSLLSDTALSFKRSEVENSWADRLPYKPPPPTSSNRVLEEVITIEDFDPRQVCQSVADRSIPEDWKIVTVCPKEREMKVIPRMFAMMVFWMRWFFANTEHNIATKIFKYIPEQTMTMPESEKTKRFLQLTRPSSSLITLSIGIDFSKWCSHFNEESVDPIGRRIGQITGGYGLFDVVHWFFGSCMMILRHSAFTPKQNVRGKKGELDPEPGIFFDCHSGLEGICQKLWTLVTLCLLHWSIWKFGLMYYITCQGDNLVLYVQYKPLLGDTKDVTAKKIRDLSSKIVVAISDAASLIGHEVKPEECSQSTGFTTYGKEMWLKGRLLETSIKSLSRMIPMTSSDVPSFFQVLSNVSATGVASSPRVNITLPCFLFTKFMENWTIRREFRSSLVHGRALVSTLASTLIRQPGLWFALLLTLVPSNLGGLPVSSFSEFLYRGHSDPLSSSLASLWIFRSIPIVKKYLSLLASGKLTGHRPSSKVPVRVDWEGLVNDPFSIPLTRPPTPGNVMSSRVREVLAEKTRNRQLRPLVRACNNEADRSKFFDTLTSSRPLYPKALHEIYKASTFGVVDDFSSRFTNTRTLYKIARKASVDVTPATILADRHFVKGTTDLMAEVYKVGDTPMTSPYRLLQTLRSHWGIGDLEGVTTFHPLFGGTLYQMPLESLTVLPLVPSKPHSHEISFLSVMSLTSPSNLCLSSRGPVMPYLGDVTSDKSVAKWIKPMDSSPPLKDVIRLLQINRLMTKPGSHMSDFIEDIVKSRTQFPLEVLYQFTRVKVGGAIAHRMSLRDNTRGSFLSTISTWASHFSVSSDLSGSMGDLNYPVAFHEFTLSLLSLSSIAFGSLKTSAPSPFGLIMRVDLSELSPLVDHEIDLPFPLMKGIIPKFQGGLYYLTADTLKLSTRSKVTSVSRLDEITRSFSPSTVDSIAQVFLDQLTQRSAVVRRPGYTRAEVSLSTVIDMPECSLISEQEYVEGASWAVITASAARVIRRLHRGIGLDELILQVFFQTSLLLVPRIFGTLTRSLSPTSTWVRLPLSSGGVEKSLIWWSLTICKRAAQIVRTQKTLKSAAMFSLGLSTLSTDMTSRLYSLLLLRLINNSREVIVIKLLVKLADAIRDGSAELDKVDHLTTLIAALNMSLAFNLHETSPQRQLRQLRGLRPANNDDTARSLLHNQAEKDRQVKYYYHLDRPVMTCIGSSLPLDLTSEITYSSKEDLVASWSLRPFPRVSDSYLRWSPLSDHLAPHSSILIVGIGSGGILECVPPSCTVRGIDLSSTLESLGQRYTNYEPPVFHPRYSTHPLSWIAGGDIWNPRVQRIVLQECNLRKYDSVILDMESRGPLDRLRLRQMIAGTGVDVWVRILASLTEAEKIASSCNSLLSSRDMYWLPEIGLGRELVIGCSSSPLGLFSASGDAVHPILPANGCQLSLTEKTLAKEAAILALGGDIFDSDRVMDFLLTKKVIFNGERISLLSLATELMEGNVEKSFSLLGRSGVRNLICVSAFI